ncbi:methyl-accepting chemotaxis protein [Brevibacillus fulvus]|uniref:Methyl-accepting chemotaxis protein n=1 Tax=Brevibacillus fulvus TaxID=1125967 RepID=A0A938XVS3_9BACL|nr:methyl-accepting chemotaxis protein [Brevibacillus fulvus]MBM7588851.1 methyl-accepting chemotaxis protein [Brevibacillus fulvus]
MRTLFQRNRKLANLQKSSFFTVRKKLILVFVLALLLPSLAVAFGSYQTAKQKIDEKMMEATEQNVTLLNQVFTQFLESGIKEVGTLAQSIDTRLIQATPGSNKGISPEVDGMLRTFKMNHPEVELAYVCTDQGILLLSPWSEALEKQDFRQRVWYKQAMEHNGQASISAPYRSLASNGMVVTISKTMADGHGVVAIDVNIDKISEIAKSVKIGSQGYVYIIDQDYNMVVHPTIKPGSAAPKNVQNDHLFTSESGSFEYLYNGVDLKKMSFVTNPITGWKLAATMYSNEVEQEASPIWHITLTVLAISLIIGALLMFYLIMNIIRPLKWMGQAAQQIAEGDLTERIQISRHDELGALGLRFNEMAGSLHDILLKVSESAMQLSASAEQLSASAEQSTQSSQQVAQSIQQMASGTDKQLVHVEETAAAMNEMSRQVQQIASNAQHVQHSANRANEKASEGSRSIRQAVEQMDQISERVEQLAVSVQTLGERSQEIGKIIDVIHSISGETNLLALNAAIEAARAGEHGRGFAVVADQVRKLAEQSATSAQQIGHLIKAIQEDTQATIDTMKIVTQEVSNGISVVNFAGMSFEQIMAAIGDAAAQIGQVSQAALHIAEQTAQVASSMNNVAAISEQSASGIQHVSGATQQQLASMEEITASAASLTKMAEELQQVISKFRV